MDQIVQISALRAINIHVHMYLEKKQGYFYYFFFGRRGRGLYQNRLSVLSDVRKTRKISTLQTIL